MLMLASKLINLKTAVEAVFRINLKTAVGPCKKAQSFDPEPLDAGVAFTFWECSTPASRGSGSKSCTFLHGPTAVFRMMVKFETGYRVSDMEKTGNKKVVAKPNGARYNLWRALLLSAVLLAGCSGLEKSEQEKLRRNNAQGELIYRHHNEVLYPLETPRHRIREKYPWEESGIGKFPKVTKEHFRCRGSSLNPPHADHKDHSRPMNFFDCGGFQKHSLPLRNYKKFFYSVFLDLLNYVQSKTHHNLIVTCGHRCPVHNSYADNSTYNQASKHMIGAEVDFYVQGMEQQPEAIVKIIMDYYQE